MPATLDSAALARGASVAFLLQVAGAGLGFVMQVLLARWMGPTDFGAYNYTIGWAGLLAVAAGVGLPTLVLRFIPAYLAEGDFGRTNGVLRVSFRVTLAVGLAISVAGSGIVVWLHANGTVSRWDGLLGVWLVPLLSLITLEGGISRAFRRIALAYGPFYVLRPALVIIGGLIWVWAGHSLRSGVALGITLAALAVATGYQGFALWHKLEQPVRTAVPTFETPSTQSPPRCFPRCSRRSGTRSFSVWRLSSRNGSFGHP
jgi:O-antigen/teichoic acid export membrane protein